jgi:hypothetical protein
MCCCTEDLLAYVSVVGLGEDKERGCERLNAACGERRRLRPSARSWESCHTCHVYLIAASLTVFACGLLVATLSTVIVSLQCEKQDPFVVLGDGGMEAWGTQPCGNRGEREANQARPECSPQIGSDPACPRGRVRVHQTQRRPGLDGGTCCNALRWVQSCRRHAGQRGQVNA